MTTVVRLSPDLELQTESSAETRALGAALAGVAMAGDRIGLRGELGAGKTQLAKGFAAGLGVRDTVNSPSFTLMAEYQGRLPLFHLDLYRLAGADDVVAGGLLDERQGEGVTLIEWPERLSSILDPGRLEIEISIAGPDQRLVRMRAAGAMQNRFLDAAREAAPDFARMAASSRP